MINVQSMQKDQILEKVFSIALAAFAVLLVPEKWFIILFVVIGQGHFFSAYLYQYKAGKIGWRYITLYILAVAAIFFGAITVSDPKLVTVIASIYFIHHFWLDERHLLGETPHPFAFLESLPFVIMFVGYIFYSAGYFDVRNIAVALGGLMLAVALGFQYKRGVHFSSKNIYFLFLNLAILGLCVSGIYVEMMQLMGFIILAHYFNWYFNYFFRFKENKLALNSYLKNIFLVNATAAGMFSLLVFFPQTFWFFSYLFSRNFFYLWAIIHILFTTRAKDFGYFELRPLWARILPHPK